MFGEFAISGEDGGTEGVRGVLSAGVAGVGVGAERDPEGRWCVLVVHAAAFHA